MDGRCRGRRGVLRRRGARGAAAHDVHVLPSRPPRAGPDRADPEHLVRVRRTGDRRGVPHEPRRDREADHARQAGAGAVHHPVRSVGCRLRRAAHRGAPRALSPVQRGYHGASAQGVVRAELCEEAIRLTALLREHPVTRTPATFALSALMALHAARLPARVDAAGELQSLWEQDRSAWNHALITEGQELLDRSAAGDELTPYHVEAAIAAIHATAPTLEATDWNAIVTLYDRLMEIAPSAVVALNRAIAIAQRDGPDQGIEAIERIADRERLGAYPFFPAALGELERRRGNVGEARTYFGRALRLARSDAERRYIERRISSAE